MSLSLGYKLIEQRNSQRSKSLTLGIGIREVGNFVRLIGTYTDLFDNKWRYF